MAWEIDFAARPFKLAVRKSTERGRPSRVNPFALPDSAYRMAARRVLGRLARENLELRHRPHYRQSFLSTAVAEAVSRWARRRWPE